jgi:hypothetical protein
MEAVTRGEFDLLIPNGIKKPGNSPGFFDIGQGPENPIEL